MKNGVKNMNVISIILVLFIVPAVLNLISTRAAKVSSPSIEHFIMSPAGSISVLGWLCAIFFMVCIIGSSRAGQFNGFLAVVFGTLFGIGILLILAPVRGFWDVTVDGDKVTSSRVWVVKKTIEIQDIDYCVDNRGGIQIYLKDGRKAMSIDSMSTNLSNWRERMKKESIEIR